MENERRDVFFGLEGGGEKERDWDSLSFLGKRKRAGAAGW